VIEISTTFKFQLCAPRFQAFQTGAPKSGETTPVALMTALHDAMAARHEIRFRSAALLRQFQPGREVVEMGSDFAILII
jgi:hypothetical protein